ncbi:MAG: S49 family peptidase [Pseudomonadota bacterium]
MSKAKKTKSNNEFSDAVSLMTHQQSSKLDQILTMFPFNIFNPVPTVAVIRLGGVIGKVGMRGGMSIESLNDSIERAFKKQKLLAVCLVINSPGGSPVQSDLITTRIRSLAEEKDVPVYSFVEDMAASGGYWIACAGDEIYASRSSVIGSVGVVSSGFGFQEAIEKLGIERRVYTEGKNKSVLDPFEPAKAADIKIIKNLQKNIHQHFVDHIKSRRKSKLTQSDDVLFNGEFWTAETAVDFGLIDGINNMYSFIKERFGDEAKISYVNPKESWFKKKLGIEIDANQFVSDTLSALKSEVKNQKFDM